MADVQLRARGAAHAVHQRDYALASAQPQVVPHPPVQLLHQGVRALHAPAPVAGLAVDADAQLDLVLAELEGGLARVGNRARAEGQAHGPGLLVDARGDGRHLVQVVAALRRGARDLLHQDRARHAAPARRVQGVLDGDVVVDDHGGDADVLHVRHLRGRLEVQDVARVVLDDVEHPRAPVGGLRGLQDRVGGR